MQEIKKWFTKATRQTCIAVVCGDVSGNVEVLDFDVKGKLFKDWKKRIKRRDPKLFNRLVIEKTQNGGRHIIYRCPEIDIPSSEKLAVLKINVGHEGEHVYKGKKYKSREAGRLSEGPWRDQQKGFEGVASIQLF